MRNLTIITALILSACSGRVSDETTPDAALPIDVGQPPDAAERPETGCGTMGNLPNLRTETLTDADPISPDLPNELQDAIIGHLRKAWKVSFAPEVFWTSTTLICDLNPADSSFLPAQKFTAAGTAFFQLPALDEDDELYGMDVEIYGDGVVDAHLGLIVYPGSNAGQVILASGGIAGNQYVNVAAAWSTKSLVMSVFAPRVMQASDVGILQVDAVGGGNLYVGRATLYLQRLP